MTVRALIFDVDGTLAETEEAHRQAFNAAFAAHDLSWFWGQHVYRDLLKVAGGRERIAHFIDAMDAPPAEKLLLHGRAAAIHAEENRIYARLVTDGRVVLREGIAKLIHESRAARLKLAIATATMRSNIDALLTSALGARAIQWFDVIATGELNVPKKPAPDIYLTVIEQLAVRSQEVIAFEDSGIGLAAAKGAGLFTVVTPTVWTANHDFSTADVVLQNLACGGPLGSLCAAHMQWLNREAA